jgi:hypothetical protein
MSWRSIQLGSQLCDQDRIILELFKNKSVRYVGSDREFARHLSIEQSSENLIVIINQPVWISEIHAQLLDVLTNNTKTFYIGINRYTILGNDTDLQIDNQLANGDNIVALIKKIVTNLNCTVTDTGTYNYDCGRYFNFVQPLTWVYGVTNVAD